MDLDSTSVHEHAKNELGQYPDILTSHCEVYHFYHISKLRSIVHHIAQYTYARITVRGLYLFREANSFPRAYLEENCELRGTDYVQGQISEHIFAPNGGYRVYYPSNLLRNARSFENWGIFNNYSMSAQSYTRT